MKIFSSVNLSKKLDKDNDNLLKKIKNLEESIKHLEGKNPEKVCEKQYQEYQISPQIDDQEDSILKFSFMRDNREQHKRAMLNSDKQEESKKKCPINNIYKKGINHLRENRILIEKMEIARKKLNNIRKQSSNNDNIDYSFSSDELNNEEEYHSPKFATKSTFNLQNNNDYPCNMNTNIVFKESINTKESNEKVTENV